MFKFIKNSFTKKRGNVAVAVSVVAVSLFLTAVTFNSFMPPENFKIPTRLSWNDPQDVCAATDALKNVVCTQKWVATEDSPRGVLLKNSSVFRAGKYTVNATYSAGFQKMVVPLLTGLTENEAAKKLYDLGFVTKIVEAPSNAPKGRVIAQSLETGKTYKNGHSLTVTVADGKMIVPSWVNLAKEKVSIDAKKLGIDVKFVEEDNQTAPPGTVTRQSESGTVKVGAQIIVYVSKNSGSVIVVPNVAGKTKSEAISILSAAGVAKIRIENATLDQPNVTVKSTKPAAGASYDSKTEFVITLEK